MFITFVFSYYKMIVLLCLQPSMINRLSNPINHNHSAAKILKVMSSTR